MLNRKRVLLGLVFIILLFLLSSCNITTSGSSVRGNGLEVSFISGTPPDTLYVQKGENDIPFELIAELKNRGSYPKNDIGSLSGRLYLTGFDKAIIDGKWDNGPEFTKIRGASSLLSDGEMEQKRYVADSITFPYDAQSYVMTLMLTACYYYETFATGTICIDPNPTSAVQNKKVCSLGDVTLNDQHAPVIITSIEQSGNQKETMLTIHFKNQNNGQVVRQFSPTSGVVSEDKCLELGFDDINKVGITAEIIGLPRGDCTPKGTFDDPIRMSNGEGSVFCRFPLDSASTTAYTTPFEITLHYGYLQTATKDVTLINTEVR